MEYEIELKLLTNENAGETIETKLLPQLNAKITKQSIALTNHYFDTSERTLRQHDIGLRIRGNNQEFEQTLKTSGKSIGGLHQRPEFNVLLGKAKKQVADIPDLGLFPLTAWPTTIDVADLQTKIHTLFSTHFERKVYLLEFSNNNIVELVWDLGEVSSGNKSVPICEIELELKKGDTALLFDVAKRIVSLMPTSIGIDSKAARGYTLLDDLPSKNVGQFQQITTISAQTTAEEFSSLLTAQLQHFQLLSVEIKRQYCETLANQIKLVLELLFDNVTKFKHCFPCLALEQIFTKLDDLVKDWTLSMQKKNISDLHVLLVRAQTTQLQLDFIQCLVEQTWSADV